MTKAQYLTDTHLRSFSAQLAHGFFTRNGGVSTGIYQSLNCGLGTQDKPEAVAENRSRILNAFGTGGGKLLTLYQIHSNQCLTVTNMGKTPVWDQAKMDAIVTNVPNLTIGVLTADCTPILFYDPHARIVGAAHAGWRGAVNGILESTIHAMENLGSKRSDIIASVGPCIGQDSYQVGAEYYKNFLDHSELNEIYFKPDPKPDHYRFDLAGYVLGRLLNLRLGQIGHVQGDTCKDQATFFSHRRATLNKEPDYARQISAIALKP
ncbi:MAG: peptidoglycan editing factor PgeF [Alphaproteobacteria bacterium]|nr:MAG: peptidoglycan editing factor PgeF [Alphaproteobacteria bacterium]